MSDEILLFSFLVGSLVVAVAVTGLSAGQMVKLYHHSKVMYAMRRLRQSKQPWVTIIIDGLGMPATEVDLTLKSLERLHYYNYDILVVKGMVLTGRRKFDAINEAYTRSRVGEIVLLLAAGDEVDAAFVKRSIARLDGKRCCRVVPNERQAAKNSLQLGGLIKLLEADYWQTLQTAQVLTSEAFLKRGQNVMSRYSRGLRLITSMIVWLAVILAIGLTGKLIIIWYVWLILTAYGLATVWLESATVAHKLRLSYVAPLALFIVPVWSVVTMISGKIIQK